MSRTLRRLHTLRRGLRDTSPGEGQPPAAGGGGNGQNGTSGGESSTSTGGSGNGQNGAQNGQEGANGAGSGAGTGGTGSGAQNGSGASSGSGGSGSGSGDLSGASHEDLVRMVGDLRRENATARTTAKDTAAQEARDKLAQDIGKTLGLVKGDEKADPEQLAKDLAERDSSLNAERVENAAYRAAARNGADPDALADSAGFLGKARKLDHSAADFATRLDALIADEVKTNTRVAAAKGSTSTARSGAQFTGAGAPPAGDRPKSLRDAMRRRAQQ